MRLATHHLFRESAIVRRAQSEPLDGLVQVTLPHERVVSAVLAAGILAFALWSAVGSMERSLWLTGVFADGGSGALTVTTEMRPRDAERLAVGMTGAVLDPTGRAPPAAGVVAEIVASGAGGAPAVVVWEVAEPGAWMAAGEACGLRAPMGRSRPAGVLFDALR